MSETNKGSGERIGFGIKSLFVVAFFTLFGPLIGGLLLQSIMLLSSPTIAFAVSFLVGAKSSILAQLLQFLGLQMQEWPFLVLFSYGPFGLETLLVGLAAGFVQATSTNGRIAYPEILIACFVVVGGEAIVAMLQINPMFVAALLYYFPLLVLTCMICCLICNRLLGGRPSAAAEHSTQP